MTITELAKWVVRGTRAVAVPVGVFWVCALFAPHSATAQAASGTWHSGVTEGKDGNWELTSVMNEDGVGFTGTLTANGLEEFGDGTVFGSRSDTGSMKFGVIYNDIEEASFQGAVSGGVIAGTYTTRHGDSGTWIGKFGPPQTK